MKHLTVDEIIDHVSFTRIDQHTLENAARVTSHISTCGACLRKVRAFQTVYDELVRLGDQSAFRRTVMDQEQKEMILDDSQLSPDGI